MLPRVLLDGRGHAAVGVAFAQHGIHGAAERSGVPRFDVFLGVGARLLGIVRNVITLLPELFDGGLQLRHRSADVRQLDDIRVGRFRDLAELLKIVADGLALREPLAELREYASCE